MEAPGWTTVLGAGSPLAVNGPPGGVTFVTVSSAVPPLVITACRLPLNPTGVVSNCSAAGIAYRPVCVPVPDRGTFTTEKLGAFVAKASAPVAPPGSVGANLTGTVSTSFCFSVTGNETGALFTLGWPAVNGSGELTELAVTPVTVTPARAVIVATADDDEPTAVGWKLTGEPVSGAVLSEPKPMTWPSRVPTYTRPPSVAGTANLLAVPIGADQIGVSWPPADGIASNASSVPPEPLLPDEYSSQTTALVGSVPLDVTTGEPEEKPKTAGESPASVSVALAGLKLNARRWSSSPT